MKFQPKKQAIQRICASPMFTRLMFAMAILMGGLLWATAVMIRYIKAV
jgi:hypothetical protein